MPYPHHPQHQHHQKIHSPSQLRRAMTSASYDETTTLTNSVNPTGFDPTGERCNLNNSLCESQSNPSSPASHNASFSTASSSAMLNSSPIGSPSPSALPSASLSHVVPSTEGPALAISRAQEGSLYLSTCPQEDMEMMPLDLSFRGSQRTEPDAPQTSVTDHQSGGYSSKSCSSTQNYSRSHRLSPYHLLTLGMARSPGTSGHPLSRSPHSRSNSPFYQLHRQTPSPYYSYLTPNGGSFYNSAENSSFQVISTTNRVLNGLSSSPGVFRPYEDHVPTEATPPPPLVHMTGQEDGPSQEPEEIEEPTYYDLDSPVQKETSVTVGTADLRRETCRPSSLYDHQFSGVNSLDASQFHVSTASPYVTSASAHDRSMMTFTSSSCSTFSSTSSISSSSPVSSTPSALQSQLPFISQEVSEQAHCDLMPHPVRDNGNTFIPYPGKDEAIQKSINQTAMSHEVQINTGNSQVVPPAQQEYRQQHQDPDSSSSLSIAESSPSSSESPSGQSFSSSLSPTSNPRLQCSLDPGPQQYPDCDGSVSSTGTITSNKENLRDSLFRPQSFFRAPDKDFMEQTCRILAEKHRNEGANRMSLLDFWISKIRIAAAQSRKSDICQNLQNKSKIKIRMVELMELQVEQSLRCDWR